MRVSWKTLVLLLGSVALPVLADDATVPSALEHDPQGWTDLLIKAGPKLEGWTRGPLPAQAKLRPASQWSLDPQRDTWSARGTAAMSGSGGKELSDFVYHVEWRFTPVPGKKGYNAGIYARNSADARIYHQAQTGDRSGGYLFGATESNGATKRFNLSKQQSASSVKPAGEWNTFEITCRGPEMTLWVNGAVANEWHDCEVKKGHVGLEAEGWRIEFRNVKVKPLADTKSAAQVQVGAAMRVITPDPLLPVSGGMGKPNPAREKRGEITARAIVFRKGDVSVAVVSLDLIGFPSVLGDRVRAKVSRIPADHILIGSTHTHSAPDCYAFPDGKGGHTGDLAYMDSVCAKAAEAINEAIDRLQPASIKIATGEAQGKIAYNYYAPDLYDRRMNVIQAVSPEGKAIATLVNYAIHPEVLGNDIGILSPDLIGPLCAKIESQAGGMALFMNRPQGGMVTADNRDLKQPRDQRPYWND